MRQRSLGQTRYKIIDIEHNFLKDTEYIFFCNPDLLNDRDPDYKREHNGYLRHTALQNQIAADESVAEEDIPPIRINPYHAFSAKTGTN